MLGPPPFLVIARYTEARPVPIYSLLGGPTVIAIIQQAD